MPIHRTPRSRLTASAACLFVALGVAGCHDAGGDPLAVILTEETRPTLLVEDLPSLPDLIDRAGLDSDLTGAVDLWLGSWEREEGAATDVRRRAYEQASRPLVRALGPAAVRDAEADLDAALRATTGLAPEGLSPAMQEHLDEAGRLHEEARGRLAAGDDASALSLVLRGADALRAVGPEGVARMLTARATRALDEGGGAGLPDVARERGERLLLGARVALDEGDWGRATRRAYYACQVLGVSPR